MRKFALTFAVAMGLVGAGFASEQLARQKGCMACHDMRAKKIGPTYPDIAKRYANRADAVDYLASRIKNGGVGVWGSVPMPRQNVSDAEARQLAQWIMSLK